MRQEYVAGNGDHVCVEFVGRNARTMDVVRDLLPSAMKRWIQLAFFMLLAQGAWAQCTNTPYGPFTCVQVGPGCTAVAGSACTSTFPGPTVAHHIILVGVYTNGIVAATVSDSASQVYTADTTVTNTDQVTSYRHYDTAAGVTTVTCTPPAAKITICFPIEVAGVITAAALDKVTGHFQTGTTFTSTATATTTQAREFLFSVVGTGASGGASITPDAGWTQPTPHVANVVDGDDAAIQIQGVGNTGAYASTGTNASVAGTGIGATIVTYKMVACPHTLPLLGAGCS